MRERPLYHTLWTELAAEKAMIFLMGPRQSGKTSLAEMISASFPNKAYFNYDLVTNKAVLLKDPTFFEKIDRKDVSAPLVVFDEIHKYRRWKNYLKGVYDQFHRDYRFLVLGSGQLNVFQKGGDSLVGRYYPLRLWPFTVAELAGQRRKFEDFRNKPLHFPSHASTLPLWENLKKLSGFPEPFLSGKETTYRRWANNYQQQVIREDIRNMTGIKNVNDVETLSSLLPFKVGAPVSMDSLARDLQVSFKSVRNWLEVFEAFYLIFRISPWTTKISRAIKKERKLYFFDVRRNASEAATFENMAAVELMRAVSTWNDHGWGDFSLRYIRNKEKEEVDFLLTNENKPMLLIETKYNEETLSKTLTKFQDRLKIPAVQLVHKPGVHRLISNGNQKCLVATACHWLASLP